MTSEPKYKAGDRVTINIYSGDEVVTVLGVVDPSRHNDPRTIYMIEGHSRYKDKEPAEYHQRLVPELKTGQSLLNEIYVTGLATPEAKFKVGDKVMVVLPSDWGKFVTITEGPIYRTDTKTPAYKVDGLTWDTMVSEYWLCEVTKAEKEEPVELKEGDRVKDRFGDKTGTVTGVYRNATQDLDAIYYVVWGTKGKGTQHIRGEYRSDLSVLHAPRTTDGAVKNTKALEEVEALRAKAKAQIEEAQETLRALNVVKKALEEG